VGIVTFHAVNGIRIILIDFWTRSTDRRRELFWATMALFALLFIPALLLMARAAIS
jgi:succinate dehydrogenase / fumarate reductase cytochrome b subunit